MNITFTLSDDAVTGWQTHLDTVINPARDQANLKPHTLETFFQEAEETTGVQHFVKQGKSTKYAAAKVQFGLTDQDLFVLAQTSLRNV